MKEKEKSPTYPEYILISVDRVNCNRISSLIVPLYSIHLQCHSILLFCSPYKKQQKPLWLGSGSPASDSVDDNSQQRAHLQNITNHPRPTPHLSHIIIPPLHPVFSLPLHPVLSLPPPTHIGLLPLTHTSLLPLAHTSLPLSHTSTYPLLHTSAYPLSHKSVYSLSHVFTIVLPTNQPTLPPTHQPISSPLPLQQPAYSPHQLSYPHPSLHPLSSYSLYSLPHHPYPLSPSCPIPFTSHTHPITTPTHHLLCIAHVPCTHKVAPHTIEAVHHIKVVPPKTINTVRMKSKKMIMTGSTLMSLWTVSVGLH